jgi:N-carbamoylputrescine amidase
MRKYFFAPGDTGFQGLRHPLRTHRRSGLLGPVVPGGRPAHGPARGPGPVLSHGHRLAPEEKDRFGAEQLDAWITVQRGHAVANGVYVAAVNRVGHEIPPGGGPGIEFWGNSFVAGPMGELLCRASTDKEEILLAEIDPARLETVRRHWPFFRDRRIDAYGGITSRYLGDES